jgi:hypothetical protein
MAQLVAKPAAGVAASRTCASRVKPFTPAFSKASRCQQKRLNLLACSAAEEEAAAEAAEAAAEAPVEDSFVFNFSEAKKNNSYSQSDVDSIMAAYSEGSGDMAFNDEFFVNITDMEDAAIFEDVDNRDGYEDDMYASAGIPEAAPVQKRGPRRDAAAAEEEDDEALRLAACCAPAAPLQRALGGAAPCFRGAAPLRARGRSGALPAAGALRCRGAPNRRGPAHPPHPGRRPARGLPPQARSRAAAGPHRGRLPPGAHSALTRPPPGRAAGSRRMPRFWRTSWSRWAPTSRSWPARGAGT